MKLITGFKQIQLSLFQSYQSGGFEELPVSSAKSVAFYSSVYQLTFWRNTSSGKATLAAYFMLASCLTVYLALNIDAQCCSEE